MKRGLKIVFVFSIFLILGLSLVSAIYITGKVVSSTCGNGKIEGTEKCDSSALGGATCASIMGKGYNGTLKCSSLCTFDTSLCVTPCNQTCSSLRYQCGTPTICGVRVSCGNCSTGYTCNTTLGGQCMPSCIPKSCSSLSKNCGTISNNCGGTLSCGICSTAYSCINNVCVKKTIWTMIKNLF
jgi:hypothetical protein